MKFLSYVPIPWRLFISDDYNLVHLIRECILIESITYLNPGLYRGANSNTSLI